MASLRPRSEIRAEWGAAAELEEKAMPKKGRRSAGVTQAINKQIKVWIMTIASIPSRPASSRSVGWLAWTIAHPHDMSLSPPSYYTNTHMHRRAVSLRVTVVALLVNSMEQRGQGASKRGHENEWKKAPLALLPFPDDPPLSVRPANTPHIQLLCPHDLLAHPTSPIGRVAEQRRDDSWERSCFSQRGSSWSEAARAHDSLRLGRTKQSQEASRIAFLSVLKDETERERERKKRTEKCALTGRWLQKKKGQTLLRTVTKSSSISARPNVSIHSRELDSHMT